MDKNNPMFTIPWISVKEALPPPDVASPYPEWTESDRVWAWGDITSFGDEMFLAMYDHSDGKWYTHNSKPLPFTDSVTHWHPIPQPPDGCDWYIYPAHISPKKESQSL